MDFGLLAQYLKLPEFALVASRLGGLIAFQPILGALAIPANLRALFVLALAALITPGLPPVETPATLGALAIAMIGELLLGVLMGLLCVAVFVGLQFAGMLIAQESGLAFGQIADPMMDEEETVLGAFYLQFGAAVYLVAGGHRVVVSACLDTFRNVPLLGALAAARNGADLIVDALGVGGTLALKIAAPTLLTLFLVNCALGFVSRTLPQLNVTTVGFSIKSLVAFAVMAVALPAAAGALLDGLENVFDWMTALRAP